MLPSSRAWSLLGLYAATLFQFAWAQSRTHVVTVGASGSFFNPAIVSAQVNDTIVFVFSAATHSIIQSSFNTPCNPLPGGFSSGGVRRSNDSVPAPTWNITVTNASHPIWYYCGEEDPFSHCTSAMVGAINPPSQQLFQQFLSAAKKATDPKDREDVELNGQGAFATQAPVTPSAAPISTSSLEPSSTVSAVQSTQTTSFSHHNHRAAAIGGSIGGIFAFFLFSFIAFFVFRHHRRRMLVADGNLRGSEDFFKYNARSLDFGRGKTPSNSSDKVKNKKKRITFVPSRMIAPPLERFRQLTTRMTMANGFSNANLSSPTSLPDTSPAPLLQQLQSRSPLTPSVPLPGHIPHPDPIPLPVTQRSPSPPPPIPPPKNPHHPVIPQSQSPSQGGKRVLPSRPNIDTNLGSPPPINSPPPRHPLPSSPSQRMQPSPPPCSPSGSEAELSRNPSTRTIRALPRLPSPVGSPRPPLPQPPYPGTPPKSILMAVDEKQGSTSTAHEQVLSPLPAPPPIRGRMQSPAFSQGSSDRMGTPPPKYGSVGSAIYP